MAVEPKIDPAEMDVGEVIAHMARETETAFVLVLGSRVEDWLEYALQAQMRVLSKSPIPAAICEQSKNYEIGSRMPGTLYTLRVHKLRRYSRR